MPDVKILIFALLGGILPATLWLWFWLREDRLHPEPKRLIFLSFFIGMAIVFIALPAEKFVEKFAITSFALILSWSAIEELLKLGAAFFFGICRRECDEPVDPMIYLITVALGFAAMENTMFLISSISENVFSGIITGNLRFVGASLLHVLSSGVIGLFFAFSFYRNKLIKTIFVSIGTVVAIALHSLFNFFIINSKGGETFIVFCFVWVLIIMLLAAFEKVKRLEKRNAQF